jgi:ATP-binding cassette subfamily B protein
MAKKDKNKKKKINYKETFREIWFFIRKFKRLFFILVFVAAILNVLSLIEVFLFREIVSNIELYLQGELLKDALTNSLYLVLIIFIIYKLFELLFRRLDIHFSNRFQVNVMADLRNKYFSHILKLDNQFHANNKTGSLISRLTRAGSSIERLLDLMFSNILPIFVKLLVFLPAIFNIGWQEGTVFIVFIVLFTVYSSYYISKVNVENKKKNRYIDTEKAIVSDVFTNVNSVKYFAKENYIIAKYNKSVDKVRRQQLKTWDIWKKTSLGQAIILPLFTITIFYISFKRFLLGEISLADISFVYVILGTLIRLLYRIQGSVRQFTRSLVDIQDLFEYGKQENRIKDKENAKDIIIKKGKIEFKNIDFDYPDDQRKVFRNLSLDIKAGDTVALVGQSGCGKSTLVKLLYRFHDLNKGEVLIDDQNIADVKKMSLRNSMSIVPQEAILFDDTIFNNIKFSRPEATDKEVWDAIKYAELHEFVKSLKKKEKTIVGERGIKLSGGQKQRVSIARAILADKKILLLDEATSALDTETEMKIQKSLEYLIKNRTSIVIAHRLSTIMRADKIVVMRKGKIVQMGNHKELMNIEGEYKKLWDLQKSSF